MRVITHIVASFLRAIIAPIMTWLLCRVTRAITQVILAYRYCAFCDADFTARYIAYGGVIFPVRHMRFMTGDLRRVISRIRQVVWQAVIMALSGGDFPRHYFNNFSFHLQSSAIHLGFNK